VYVTCGRGGELAEIDVASAKVSRVLEKVGARPWGVAITADGKKLYTANGPSNDVSVIDRATGQVLRRIPAGSFPWGVAIAP
jgi:YVTN family beta-propeller protein